MKRNLFQSCVIAIAFSGVILTACQKNDTTPPVLTFNGRASTIYVSLNHKYLEIPATATDNKDGSVDVTSDESYVNPNVNLVGTYYIHYSASDNSGNIGRLTRTVIVSNDAQPLCGTYNVNDNITANNSEHNSGVNNYTVTVTSSITVDNLVFLTNISGLSASVTDSAKVVSGAVISISSQPFPFPLDPGTISGSGTVSSNAITGLNYTINYTSGGSDSGVSTWTKQ